MKDWLFTQERQVSAKSQRNIPQLRYSQIPQIDLCNL